MKKLLILSILAVLCLFYLPEKTIAQTQDPGYYQCVWLNDSCQPLIDNCTEGYTPGTKCNWAKQQLCNSISGVKIACVGGPGGDDDETCGHLGQQCCATPTKCVDGDPTDPSSPTCVCKATSGGGDTGGGDTGGDTVLTDPHGECGEDYIDSAIGCIPIKDYLEMAEFWMRWGIGIASGISFLLILYAGYLLMTSTGDPKKIQAGRELLTSAVAGLIFLVFSVFILRLIGVDILHIPGWGV